MLPRELQRHEEFLNGDSPALRHRELYPKPLNLLLEGCLISPRNITLDFGLDVR